MHVHLPKPLHGWREFAGEVGIIVLGVLLALSTEQVVQTWHERHESEQADDIIRGELEYNLGRLRSRLQIRSCVNRRMEELQDLIDKAASVPKIVTPGWIGRPQFWTFHSSRWQAESQAGRAALIEREKLANYGIMYAQMSDIEEEMKVEQTDWARLRMLEHLQQVDEPTLSALREALQDARYRSWRIALVTSQLLIGAKTLKLSPTVNASAASESVCLPITTTRQTANRLSAWPFGEP